MTTTTTTTLGPIYVIQMLSLWVGVARGETQLGHVHVSVFDFCASADQRNEVKDFAPFFRTFSSMVAFLCSNASHSLVNRNPVGEMAISVTFLKLTWFCFVVKFNVTL